MKNMVWASNLLLYLISLCVIFGKFESIFSKQIPCDFNKLCFCYNYTRQLAEVTCIGVALSKIPPLPANHFYRIRIIGARDIAIIENEDLRDIKSLSSFTLSRSKLSLIELFAFSGSGLVQTLTTLELSYCQIREFPNLSLVHLHLLQWLSLRGNKIEELKSKDLKDLSSLRSLILSENSLSIVKDQTFRDLSNLEYLDLDGNMITRVEGTPFPSSLTTLSFANCLLQEVPLDSISNLKNIQILQLRGNLIRHLPHMKIPTQNLEMLDLSHNLISSFSTNVFTTSEGRKSLNNPLNAERTNPEKYKTGNNVNISYSGLRIRDLHLDFNFIQSLPTGIFRHICVERLSLSNNRITSTFISPEVFDGPMKEQLKALDLNYNLIDTYPEALKNLIGIRQLLLKNNRISFIDEDAFVKCAKNLEMLDLSRNLLTIIPSSALSVTKNMLRINLHDNLISTLDDNDLGDWSVSLLSLSLSKNGLKSISRDAFRHAKNLRELRLGGNNILHASSDILVPLRSLELLDLSYALNYVNAGQVIQSVSIGSLESLKWLQLDYNRLKYTPSSLVFNALPALMHCDLENNQITEISSDFNGNSNLSTIILSRNQLTIIESHTFRDLPHLENIALYLNQIKTVEKHAFKNLSKLKTVILSKNYITKIEGSAFYNLSDNSPLLTILLDENQLKCLSMDIFAEMAHKTGFLYINVSHNEIKQLSGCAIELTNKTNNNTVSDHHQPKQTLNIRVLDLSYNSISNIPYEFSETICKSLHSLHLNHNKLSSFPFETMKVCTELQILILDNNLIKENINHLNITCSSDLQVLSLRNNKISSLEEFVPIFNQMKNLRYLDLSHNLITNLPENAFIATIIEKLFLTNNKLSITEIYHQMKLDLENNCFGVKPTLKYFDLSHNYFSSVPIQVMSCENLIELSLANNLIQELAERSLTQFIRLLSLDLSNNPIKKIDNKSFSYNLQNLNILRMNNVSLSTIPVLNLPHLTNLELSDNIISVIEPQSIAKSRSIRYLDLSKNFLQDVPRYIWKYMTKLQILQLQYNPIDILDTSSFSELHNLRHLDIRGLSLQYIDTRLLHNHKYLIGLKTSTYPNVRSFRLHDLLAKSASLRSCLVEVQESTLSHQIQWAFGTKLKELIITGSNLIKILPDAFLGLHNTYDLTLRVTNTNISILPTGLLKYLADIRYMTIDLRKNKLKTLKPDVFLVRSDNKLNKDWESHQLLGGILLDDNPLKCDCNLLWISDWMKRLISDMRIMNIEAALQANSMASMSQCIASHPLVNNYLNDSNLQMQTMRISLLDLRSDDISCENISLMLSSNVILIVLLIINRLCSLENLHSIYI